MKKTGNENADQKKESINGMSYSFPFRQAPFVMKIKFINGHDDSVECHKRNHENKENVWHYSEAVEIKSKPHLRYSFKLFGEHSKKLSVMLLKCQ
jgi:hypothetical protein